MNTGRRDENNTSGAQADRAATCSCEDTAALINRADRECGMAMSLVANSAVASPATFRVGHGRVAPELGGVSHIAMVFAATDSGIYPLLGRH